jgi:hypothetical protein
MLKLLFDVMEFLLSPSSESGVSGAALSPPLRQRDFEAASVDIPPFSTEKQGAPVWFW